MTPRMASIHTKLELSICRKKLSRFSIKDELPFTLGITRPSGTTKIEKISRLTNKVLREWMGCCLNSISMTYGHKGARDAGLIKISDKAPDSKKYSSYVLFYA